MSSVTISNLSEEQVMLAEQLTYFDNDGIAKAAGVAPGEYKSIYDLLKNFDEAALDRLEGKGDDMRGWAAIIRQIKSDRALYGDDAGNGGLIITDRNKDVHVMCFAYEGSDEALVAFQGTTGSLEWYDNMQGLWQADTKCQQEALEYIENLPYGNVTVTGHSKGGNKAQYVTILSDKVSRCVSMDGQGFSKEFMEKYYAEIAQKGSCISNYFLESDFVSILLFPVPGSLQQAVAGNPDAVLVDHHMPQFFYRYYQDENGDWRIEIEDGSALKKGERTELMNHLHEFTCFVVNVMPLEDREEMGEYLGALLSIISGTPYNYKGHVYGNALDLFVSDPEMCGKLLGYLLKYFDTYNLNKEEIIDLLEFLGLYDYLDELLVQMYRHPEIATVIGKASLDVYAFVALLIENLKDGKNDHIIEGILWAFGKIAGEDYKGIWQATEDTYHGIPPFDKDDVIRPPQLKTGKTRDFSDSALSLITAAAEEINSHTCGSISNWYAYADESWYDSMLIPNAVSGINGYFNKVYEINTRNVASIQTVFANADSTDRHASVDLESVSDKLSEIAGAIREIFERLS